MTMAMTVCIPAHITPRLATPCCFHTIFFCCTVIVVELFCDVLSKCVASAAGRNAPPLTTRTHASDGNNHNKMAITTPTIRSLQQMAGHVVILESSRRHSMLVYNALYLVRLSSNSFNIRCCESYSPSVVDVAILVRSLSYRSSGSDHMRSQIGPSCGISCKRSNVRMWSSESACGEKK
jgi:hypothetical protein